jgi:hypothetical protein
MERARHTQTTTPSRRRTNDAALAPALVAALERRAHRADVADALEGVVDAAVRDVDDRLLDRLVREAARVQRLRRAKLACARELALVDVDADDARGASSTAAHDGSEPHATQTEDGADGARSHLDPGKQSTA